ncbi:hypothetical protein Celaphus_00015227 [Cervus elaphus hippelaphus]|uniref:Uncharacterized protein n=1 Tax=Cervus elaphus hippelaphus TaxID=46360 RepID=A0A212CT44_CEREH|nr:hypothetical protein Celaphus_00015227 [Cervus elaphus hippelaphus]
MGEQACHAPSGLCLLPQAGPFSPLLFLPLRSHGSVTPPPPAMEAVDPRSPRPCRTCTDWKEMVFPASPCSSTTCCAPSSPSPRRAASS